MGDFNKIDGAKEIPIPGGVLKLGRLTNRVKAQYEDWMEARARLRVFQLRASLDEKEFKESMQAVQEACASGAFSWGGDAWLASLKQVPGIVKLVCFLSEAAKDKADETKVLELMVDPQYAEGLVVAVREVLDSSSNFLVPPVRGMAD